MTLAFCHRESDQLVFRMLNVGILTPNNSSTLEGEETQSDNNSQTQCMRAQKSHEQDLVRSISSEKMACCTECKKLKPRRDFYKKANRIDAKCKICILKSKAKRRASKKKANLRNVRTVLSVQSLEISCINLDLEYATEQFVEFISEKDL